MSFPYNGGIASHFGATVHPIGMPGSLLGISLVRTFHYSSYHVFSAIIVDRVITVIQTSVKQLMRADRTKSKAWLLFIQPHECGTIELHE